MKNIGNIGKKYKQEEGILTVAAFLVELAGRGRPIVDHIQGGQLAWMI